MPASAKKKKVSIKSPISPKDQALALLKQWSVLQSWKRTDDTQEESSGEKSRVALYQALHDRGEAEEHHVACEPRMRREFLRLGQYTQTAEGLALNSPSSIRSPGFRTKPDEVSTLKMVLRSIPSHPQRRGTYILRNR